MFAAKTFEIVLTNCSVFEMKLRKEIVISYAICSTAIYWAATDNMAALICPSLNWTMDQATVAPIRQPWSKVTDLSFASQDEEITNSTPTSQNSHLSRPVKTKHGHAQRQQNRQVGNLGTKTALSQHWQLVGGPHSSKRWSV